MRKIGTNKSQLLHQMRLRQFAPRQTIPDIAITPREWQPDPEVVNKHDDIYARAWECEHDKPIFESDYKILEQLVHPKLQYDPPKQLMK